MARMETQALNELGKVLENVPRGEALIHVEIHDLAKNAWDQFPGDEVTLDADRRFKSWSPGGGIEVFAYTGKGSSRRN